MFDSKRELLDAIHLGEATFLELKEIRFAGERVTAPSRDSLADELAAFANGHGGVCLLGIEDKHREIIGIPVDRLSIAETFIRQICIDKIQPPIVPIIEPLFLPSPMGGEVAVIKVEVDRGFFVHQSPGGYFYRIGSSKRRMPPDYLSRLFDQRDQIRVISFDEQLVSRARLEDLDFDLYSRFRTSLTGDSVSSLLTKLHMAKLDDDNELQPTVAGILMASVDPRRWLPNAYIQAVKYRGNDIRAGGGVYQLDAADIEGPLDHQIVGACKFVLENMQVAATKDQGRRDLPQFDMTAVFEAIVNAVAHRDYSIYGSKIRLRMFDDRLELYSPGSIPNGMTVESLPHLQSTRNEVITSLLAKCPVPGAKSYIVSKRQTMMDIRGEGVQLIRNNSKELSGRFPNYVAIDDAELLLTIYAANV